MYTPHEKTDGFLRRIYQTTYGRTDSKKITEESKTRTRSSIAFFWIPVTMRFPPRMISLLCDASHEPIYILGP